MAETESDIVVACLKAGAEAYCSLHCPSVWKSGEGQPHCDQCKRNHMAIRVAERRERAKTTPANLYGSCHDRD